MLISYNCKADSGPIDCDANSILLYVWIDQRGLSQVTHSMGEQQHNEYNWHNITSVPFSPKSKKKSLHKHKAHQFVSQMFPFHFSFQWISPWATAIEWY